MKLETQMTVQRGEDDIAVTVYLDYDGGELLDLFAQDQNGNGVALTEKEQQRANQEAFQNVLNSRYEHNSDEGL